ncbi:aspartate ammonia-lyase [Candidatus Peregrinibacteria bacterium]|jgi:aspartate ammonia-lyase|nr:aspartate ammonia-lyase [Candidatus Peregrinibacteria bacterium]MBT4056333.1 aspartate ammonia-lyase [Candidatus Peregrinibacteria bacterium]
MANQKQRSEKDSLGTIKVPSDSYYGAFTTRALANFQISNMRAPKMFKKTLGLIKRAAAETNLEVKQLDQKLAKAIIQAAQEFEEGKFDTEFRLDVLQAGAGTPFNMNTNEIIANRANVLLKGQKGKNSPVHPNNHVNLGQSSNDVIPSTTKIAALLLLQTLLEETKKLEKAFDKKATQFKTIKKVGRTHLQDAVPMTLGHEFDAYSKAITRSRKSIEKAAEDMHVIGLGGTAIGTGILAHPNFKKKVVEKLSKLTGLKLKNPENLTETTNNYAPFADFSNTLTLLASNLFRIAMDLKLLSSGPDAGINELDLPEVQPGSSIMPGKINPSIPESVEMAFYHISGNNETIKLAAMHGQLELNSNCPIIMYNLLQTEEILTNTLNTFRTKCIDGIEANKKQIKRLYDGSNCEATTLVPKYGYDKVAEMIKKGKLKN